MFAGFAFTCYFVRVSNSSLSNLSSSFIVSNSTTSIENSFGVWSFGNTASENRWRHSLCTFPKKHKAVAMKLHTCHAHLAMTPLDASGSLVPIMTFRQQVPHIIEVVCC